MWLVAVAWLTAPVWVALSVVRVAQLRNASDTDQTVFAVRFGVVAVAWLVAIGDPSGGLVWLLD